MQEKSFHYFILPQEAGTLNIEKELEKVHPKLKKYLYYMFTGNICSACSPIQVVVVLQICIYFAE